MFLFTVEGHGSGDDITEESMGMFKNRPKTWRSNSLFILPLLIQTCFSTSHSNMFFMVLWSKILCSNLNPLLLFMLEEESTNISSDGLNPIIILVPVILAVVIIIFIVAGIMIYRRLNGKISDSGKSGTRKHVVFVINTNPPLTSTEDWQLFMWYWPIKLYIIQSANTESDY